MTRPQDSEIETIVNSVVCFDVVAKHCRLRLSYDHAPGADRWTVSGEMREHDGRVRRRDVFVGTRAETANFVYGYLLGYNRAKDVLEAVQCKVRDLMEQAVRDTGLE